MENTKNQQDNYYKVHLKASTACVNVQKLLNLDPNSLYDVRNTTNTRVLISGVSDCMSGNILYIDSWYCGVYGYKFYLASPFADADLDVRLHVPNDDLIQKEP